MIEDSRELLKEYRTKVDLLYHNSFDINLIDLAREIVQLEDEITKRLIVHDQAQKFKGLDAFVQKSFVANDMRYW